jgi:hypothetical protein
MSIQRLSIVPTLRHSVLDSRKGYIYVVNPQKEKVRPVSLFLELSDLK